MVARLEDAADADLSRLALTGMSAETALALKEDLSRGHRALSAIEKMLDDMPA